ILKLDYSTHISELGKTIGEELLTPTKIYAETIHSIIKDLPVRGIAHITGGGIEDNLLRIIPRACEIVIRKGSWDIPPVFSFLQESGKISDSEMMRTFNNGIGLIAVVPEQAASEILDRLLAMNEKAFLIGNIAECKSSSNTIRWI
ncbi:MAG: phosphoribosylformylglycinamidine cyclo-ligase, partial [Desulfobacterales bacterium]|nr:phosphoribosylformylglycinamidine cyclo-ligase [Desulfobacterales bacterium]